MPLVALDGMPHTSIGLPNRLGALQLGSVANITTLDSVPEACFFVGQIWNSDGNSHTIDTTGSSGIFWRNNGYTLTNAGTTLKVGLAQLDTAGPPPRPVNVGGVATLDVSRTYIGGSVTLTSVDFNLSVPDTGSMTIANGQLVAMVFQMTARGGTDQLVIAATNATTSSNGMPAVVTYIPTTYAITAGLPNAVIIYNDGTKGFFVGGHLSTNMTSVTFSNSTATREAGNLIWFPYPVAVHGVAMHMGPLGNFDIILYSDPQGTPAVVTSLSALYTQQGVTSGNTVYYYLFPTPVILTPFTTYALAIKATSGSNITLLAKTMPAANPHPESEPGAAHWVGITRGASGAFTTVNQTRYSIGPLIATFEHPARSRSVMGL